MIELKKADNQIIQVYEKNRTVRLVVDSEISEVDIKNSYFYNIINQGSNGGAIYYTTTSGTLNIENTNFLNCQASGNGGVLYMKSSQTSECSLSFVCGLNYKTSSTGQFDYIYLTTSSNINYIQSSMVITTSTNENAKYTMYHKYKIMTYSNINISGNHCEQGCVTYDYPYTQCNIEYSSIRKNIADDKSCLWLLENANKNIKYCNVIENKQEDSVYSIFETYGPVIIACCNIISNDEGSGYIFYVNTGTVTCNNCYIPSNQRSKYGTVYFNYCNSATNINVHKCTIITPKRTPIRTPKRTPVKTPNRTPIRTPKRTPIRTPKRTPIRTPVKTPIITPELTPMQLTRGPIRKPKKSKLFF